MIYIALAFPGDKKVEKSTPCVWEAGHWQTSGLTTKVWPPVTTHRKPCSISFGANRLLVLKSWPLIYMLGAYPSLIPLILVKSHTLSFFQKHGVASRLLGLILVFRIDFFFLHQSIKETWLLVCKLVIFAHLHHFLVQTIHLAVIKKTTAFS